jgi:non-structural maintenance of chromosomes element 1
MSEDGDIPVHYNDGNRAFLQSLLARGTMKFEDGQNVLAAIFTVQEGKQISQPLQDMAHTFVGKETDPKDVTQADFDSYISAAADAISPYDYEIRSTQHQITKERIYALVNSVSDPLTQLATIRTMDEISYIKRLLDAMFETHNTKRREVMAVTSLQAMETRVRRGSQKQSEGGETPQATQSSDRGLSQNETEKLLAHLVKETWLERSAEGFYTLSPRALLELRSWLVEAYNDLDDPDSWQRIKFCQACREIVTIGQRCTERECNVRLHNICTAAFWNSRPGKKCPACETPWTGKAYVGQKAITSTEEYLKGKRRSGGKRKSDAVEEEEEEEEAQAEAENSNRRRNRRRHVGEESSREEEDTPVEDEGEGGDEDE